MQNIFGAFEQSLATYRSKFATGQRQMDPDKLCKTMFFAGLHLDFQTANQAPLIQKAIDTSDAIVEHPGLQEQAKLLEFFKFFSGQPLNLPRAAVVDDRISDLQRQVEELQLRAQIDEIQSTL